MLALAGQWFGEGEGVDNFLVVTIETGVGLGVVIKGEPRPISGRREYLEHLINTYL